MKTLFLLALFSLVSGINAHASETLRVMNCVNGVNTVNPSQYVADTIAEWKAGGQFAGVVVDEDASIKIQSESFFKTGQFTSKDLALVSNPQLVQILESDDAGISCVVMSGVEQR